MQRAALVAAPQLGSKATIKDWLSANQGALYAAFMDYLRVVSLAQNIDDAHAIHPDKLQKFLKKVANFQGPDHAARFLATVAKNACLDVLRNRQKQVDSPLTNSDSSEPLTLLGEVELSLLAHEESVKRRDYNEVLMLAAALIENDESGEMRCLSLILELGENPGQEALAKHIGKHQSSVSRDLVKARGKLLDLLEPELDGLL